MLGGILFVFLIILILFGIVAVCVPAKTFIFMYSSIGAVIFSCFLIYDTQKMIGGKHKFDINPEEYIFAAHTLYFDIIDIFLYIVRCLK